MRTLKDVNIEMYENISWRMNEFLSESEQYIVDQLQSEPDWENDEIITYTEDEAFKVVQQSCDWIDTTDTENALWCAWYSSWYEAALKEIKDEIESSNNKLITADAIKYLLTN